MEYVVVVLVLVAFSVFAYNRLKAETPSGGAGIRPDNGDHDTENIK